MSTLTGVDDIDKFKNNPELYKGRQTINTLEYITTTKIGERYWKTNQYEIWEMPVLNQLSIRRLDGMAVESWYDMWNIKNAIWGEETLAVEIYPKRSDLIDGCNHRHLFKLSVKDKIDFGNASNLILNPAITEK